MLNLSQKEIKDYSDEDLLSLVKNPFGINKERLSDIIEVLKERGFNEQVNNIEKAFIKAKPIFSKFWNRVGASLIDGLVLGLLGLILSLFLKNFFFQMGGQGVLVGLTISLVYFGLGNSKLFNGQTIGKRIIKLQVVDSNKELIPIHISILRALIYTIPYFLLNYRLSGWSDMSVLFISKGILCLTILIVLPIHLYINVPTRQGIHDLIMKTYVIQTDAYPRQFLRNSKVLYTYIAIGLSVIIIGVSAFINMSNNLWPKSISELKPIKEQIDRIDNVEYSEILRNTSTFKKLGSETNIPKKESIHLIINLKENIIANLRPDDVEDLSLVKDAVRIVLNNYFEVNQLDYILVDLKCSYNIGIYWSSRLLSSSNSPDKWKQIVR